MSNYGTVNAATSYFANRLHATVWTNAIAADRLKALIAATQIIDALNFKGDKNSVYLLDDESTDAEIRAADASQELEFPRDEDTVVPTAIETACYEIAYALLDGRDPDTELETLGVSSQGYGPVRTSYARDGIPIEHIVNGVPSATAWRILRPFLRDSRIIKLNRVS